MYHNPDYKSNHYIHYCMFCEHWDNVTNNGCKLTKQTQNEDNCEVQRYD